MLNSCYTRANYISFQVSQSDGRGEIVFSFNPTLILDSTAYKYVLASTDKFSNLSLNSDSGILQQLIDFVGMT